MTNSKIETLVWLLLTYTMATFYQLSLVDGATNLPHPFDCEGSESVFVDYLERTVGEVEDLHFVGAGKYKFKTRGDLMSLNGKVWKKRKMVVFEL